jgi:hypothetical protein
VQDGAHSRVVTDDLEKSALFAEFFSSIYSIELDTTFENLPAIMPTNSVPRIEITSEIVMSKLNQLKVDKSPGPDMLHPKVLHEVRSSIVPYLVYLFQFLLHHSVIPDEWKHSIITVLHKKGKKDKVENYRSISLTCITCKVMESIICDQVMGYFITNKLFSDKQYGFIKNRSTVVQLLRILDDWSNSLNQGKQVDVIYTDFEKAFDKVPHKRLLSKLHSYGISDELICWIETYLHGRTQCVRVNSAFSESKPVLSGIPQGSVLGPLLFIIYINDLPNVCRDICNVFMFADDAKLYKCVSNQLDADNLNLSFNNIMTWSQNWLMKLNINKCKVLSLRTTKANIVTYSYGVANSDTLERVDNIKDLGVNMTCNLSFRSHVYEKINLAYRMLGLIKRNFFSVDSYTFITLYKSFVRCHLEYATSVWNPCSVGLVHDLEKVQKRATKYIRECKHMSYKQRLEYLKLPTLRYRRLRGDMIQVYHILHNKYEPDIAPVLARNLDSRTRGNSLKLLVERCNVDIRKFSFCNRVVNYWNALPEIVVSSASLHSFKINIDKHFMQQDIFYEYDSNL